MRTIAAAVLAAIISLGLVVAPAFAKGPTAATVEGPGIDGQHTILPESDYVELGRLTEATGFWNVFSDRGLADEPPVPESELGPRYTVRWQMGTWTTTYAYPFASTPALHLPRTRAANGRDVGGWTTGTRAMRTLFETYGAAASGAAPVPADSAVPEATGDGTAATGGTNVDGSSNARLGVAAYVLGGATVVLLTLASVLLMRRGRAPQAVLRRGTVGPKRAR